MWRRAVAALINIEVVLATADRQVLAAIEVGAGATVADVISESRLHLEFPELPIEDLEVGVWGKPVARDHVVNDGDRVEVYRPLRIDPREARRQLARIGRTMGKTADS